MRRPRVRLTEWRGLLTARRVSFAVRTQTVPSAANTRRHRGSMATRRGWMFGITIIKSVILSIHMSEVASLARSDSLRSEPSIRSQESTPWQERPTPTFTRRFCSTRFTEIQDRSRAKKVRMTSSKCGALRRSDAHLPVRLEHFTAARRRSRAGPECPAWLSMTWPRRACPILRTSAPPARLPHSGGGIGRATRLLPRGL
jgi:hypothetical protein